MAWNVVVGFDLVGIGVSVGHESFVHFCGAVCTEEEKAVGAVSGIFLLFDVGMAHFIVLRNDLHFYVRINHHTTGHLGHFVL